MLPPIPALRIIQIDEGFPTQKPDNLLELPLVPPPPEFIFTKSGQQFISDLNAPPRDKGKKIVTESDIPVKTSKKSNGWSQEQIDKHLEESIRIQSLKDNLNLMLGISVLFQEGVIYDISVCALHVL